MSLSKSQQQLLSRFKNKSILILGAAREGLSTLAFLRRHLPQNQTITLADQSSLGDFSPQDQTLISQDSNLETIFGSDYLLQLPHLDSFDFIIKSPGISPYLEPFKSFLASDSSHHFLSQTQLFMELCPCPIIGITGTKGKSTTSSMIHHVLSTNHLPSHLMGNIGIPPLSQLEELTKQDIVVLELSSHQLLDLTISPHIAVIQDINPEHLDYYPDYSSYAQAKANIARYQKPPDIIIYNSDFKQPRLAANLSPAQKLVFHAQKPRNYIKNQDCLYFSNNKAYYSLNNQEEVISIKNIRLKGRHNLQNIAPAIIVGFHYDLSSAQIQAALESFTPLHHRLEYVTTINEVAYYNDSMATVPEATIAALEAFSDHPLILLAGGSEKNSNYELLAKAILSQPIKQIISFPPTGKRIIQALESQIKKQCLSPIQIPIVTPVTSMSQAVKIAYQAAQPGDIVLLSPASASFGLFKNYADRGDQFVKAVQSLV